MGVNSGRFHLIPTTSFRWMNPIGSYTFKLLRGSKALCKNVTLLFIYIFFIYCSTDYTEIFYTNLKMQAKGNGKTIVSSTEVNSYAGKFAKYCFLSFVIRCHANEEREINYVIIHDNGLNAW